MIRKAGDRLCRKDPAGTSRWLEFSLLPVFFVFIVLGVTNRQVANGQTPYPVSGGVTVPQIPHRLTLADAERLLLERNLSIISAKYQIEANRAAKLIAGFRPNPTLTVGAEQFNLSNRLVRNMFKTDSSSAAASTYTVRYDQLIERGGKRQLRTDLADQQLKASEAQMLDTMRLQLFQLRQAFTMAALARENLTLAQATLDQYEQTIRLTAIKVDNGEVAGVELYRVQVAALQYQQAVQQAQTNYHQATRDILTLLAAGQDDLQPDSRPPDSTANRPSQAMAPASAGRGESFLDIDYMFTDSPVIQNPQELKLLALESRPDVRTARHLLESAMRSVELAKAQRVRDLSVGTFYQRVGSDQTSGVNVTIPLFVHNNGLAAIDQALSLQSAAAAQLRQAEMQTRSDVDKSFLIYQAARRTLDIYNSTTLERANKLRTIASISYREGATNLIEFLDAQRTYNQTVSAYNQARADYQMALWQLEVAVGQTLK